MKLVTFLKQSFGQVVVRLAGFVVVFHDRMRRRNAVRDLFTSVIVTGLVITACYFETAGIGTPYFGTRSVLAVGDLVTHWTIESIAVTGLLCAVFSAFLGAASMPSIGEFESVQSALLTRLKPLDICLGRLAAGIWVPVTMVLSSAVFWLGLNIVAARYGTPARYGPVAEAHATILLFFFAVGAIAFMCSGRRRPGANQMRGCITALVTGAVFISAVWLINPIISRLDSPGRLIAASLVINPGVCIASVFQVDILREEWLYNHLLIQDYPFYYPAASESCGLFLATGCTALGVSVMGLKRAYR